MGGQHGIVGFYDRGGHARRRVDGEFELALLAIVGSKTLEEKSTETRTSSANKGVEDQETLERGAVVYPGKLVLTLDMEWISVTLTGNTSNAVNDAVDHLLANGVVATGV